MRVRLRFAKLGKVRFTSHRDVARMWERAFRRVSLPLAYSEGFSPRPKVSFGLALPTGHESVAEYLDLELVDEAEITVADLPEVLSAALPAGVDATAAAHIDPRALSLQEEVTSCTWRFGAQRADGAEVGEAELADRLGALLAASSAPITRSRKGVQVVEDVRPGILDLRLTGGSWLEADLATKPRGLRPADVLAALGGELAEHGVCRHHQWIQRDGARHEPLDGLAAATSAARAEARAS